MTLSVTVARELRRELELLQDSRAKVAGRIQAIELLIGTEPKDPGARAVQVRGGVSKARVRASAAPARSAQRMSLRLKVLNALQQIPKATAADVAQHLQGDGVQVGGATSLRERVSHELSRLRRNGIIRKSRSGKYELRIIEPVVKSNSSSPATEAGEKPVLN